MVDLVQLGAVHFHLPVTVAYKILSAYKNYIEQFRCMGTAGEAKQQRWKLGVTGVLNGHNNRSCLVSHKSSFLIEEPRE
jgi:hypothetical protein